MFRILLLIGILNSSSCTHFFQKQRESQWALLDDVRSVSCNSWPLGEKDLDIENLIVLKSGQKVSFLAESKLRDGSKVFQYLPFLGESDLATSDMKSMSFGRDSVALEGDLTEGGNSLAVAYNQGTRDATLKLHSVGTNVVSSETSSFLGSVRDGSLTSTESGYWLLLHQGSYQVAYVDNKPVKGVLPTKLFPKLRFSSRPTLFLNSEKDSLSLLEFDRKFRREGQPPGLFSVRFLTAEGEVSSPMPVDISMSGGAETWTATGRSGGFDLALVDGDSLIGQATLKIAGVRLGPNAATTEWNRQISLKNMHVSQLVWASSAGARWVLMLKWIDGESTLAAYKVGTAGVESINHFGVFPKGTALVDAFYSGINSELIAVVRNKVGYRWNYEICSLGSAD